MTAERFEGWLFLRGSEVPSRWAERAETFTFVPLSASELLPVLEGEPSGPEIGAEDKRLIELVERGKNAEAIGHVLGISARSVERRLARLRARFGVSTTIELVSLLARRGM